MIFEVNRRFQETPSFIECDNKIDAGTRLLNCIFNTIKNHNLEIILDSFRVIRFVRSDRIDCEQLHAFFKTKDCRRFGTPGFIYRIEQ